MPGGCREGTAIGPTPQAMGRHRRSAGLAFKDAGLVVVEDVHQAFPVRQGARLGAARGVLGRPRDRTTRAAPGTARAEDGPAAT